MAAIEHLDTPARPPVDRSRSLRWHALTADETVAAQESGQSGLSEAEACERLARLGPNRLPPPKRRGPFLRFFAQFHDVLIYVLLGATVVTALLGHWIDAQVILAVVLINAVIGFLQEGKAENALEAIRDMLAPKASVIRDGDRKTVPGGELVPGDIVLLEAGARVPADIRLMDVKNLKIDEAVLTGESVAVEKATLPVGEAMPIGDRTSMAFSGTLVTYGQGKGVVVATGAETAIGRISGLLSEVTTLQTPLTRQMGVFAKWLTGSILGLAVLVLAFGLLVRDYDFTEIFMAVVGLTVAAIPEGLPAILTITLAIGVQGMARRNAIVRRLPAIETLGSVSVICSDKTGTLTRNEMAVVSIATAKRLFTVSGVGYAPHGGFSLDGGEIEVGEYPLLAEMTRAALLCNDANLHGVNGQWTIEGDPMEGALLAVACKAGLDPGAEARGYPRTDVIPFDAEHRFMATLHHSHTGAGFIYVKGAPERIVDMCAKQRGFVGDVALDTDYWQSQADEIAASGQRVLAVAMKTTDPSHTVLKFGDVENGLTFLGLFGLIDPPREEAIAAVAECQAAGIHVKMITGDHAGTAIAIARQLGLANPSAILTGSDLDSLDDEILRRRVQDTAVFARTSPEHKLRLVMALQAEGAVVAMTGDGVNDAPALKRAAVGAAMGLNGSEAAKEASEMVLADDNFATIAEAVRAGRTVYDNLKKAILFILPTNGGEALVMIVAILLGSTLPITAVQILWVNMVTAVTLALALAFEPAEPDVMRRPPRAADEAILSGFLIWRVVFVSTVFLGALFGKYALAQAQGASVEEARTIVVNTLVVLEIFYLFSVRYLKASSITWRGMVGTRAVLIAVGAVTALQLMFTYAPFMESFFDTRPLSLAQGVQIVAVGFAVLLILEIEKWVQSLFAPRRRSPGAGSAAGGMMSAPQSWRGR
jgi:magnesium-transporting ATPase (P-type)